MIHTLAMVYIEGMPVSDAIWLTMTSATTVGYGDLSAQTTTGRFATIILLYFGGIAILAQAAAMYFEYRQEIRNKMLKGDWSWIMKNHIVILNCTDEIKEAYFINALKQLRSSNLELSSAPVVLVGNAYKDGISDALRKLDVAHVCKSVHDDEALKAASIMDANTIVILSIDSENLSSDSINFEIAYRLREMGVKSTIIAEAVSTESRSRLLSAGANNVVRPVRIYPEMLVRTILAPGSEQIIDDLFDSFGEECVRYDINIKNTWRNIIVSMVDNDIGTPIAYLDNAGCVISNAPPYSEIEALAVFIIVREGNLKSKEELESALLIQSK